MRNNHIAQRLAGIQTILNGVYQANATMSSCTKGGEREAFIDEFLSKVLPPVYRFGTGEATDSSGNKSGQLDVVVEYPFSPTLPTVGNIQSRLYLAESVAAVIEVKSDISSQWEQACSTASQLAPLKRNFGTTMVMGMAPTLETPLFIASYTGWKNIETIQKHLQEEPNIAGILVIDSGIFISSQQYLGIAAEGPLALWGLISCLHLITNSLQAANTNPMAYALDL
ncbi:MAG: DUF6602 domain-containing protein [Gammaproteobacteria bacterium]|nr:DUF6602 domain-containing protein [Gammaproteobacteria bacterium]